MMDVLPRWERWTYWTVTISSICYSLYLLHLEGKKLKSDLYYSNFQAGWSWIASDQDLTDLEWLVWRNWLTTFLFYNGLHIVISQLCFCLKVQPQMRAAIVVVYDLSAIALVLGLRPLAMFLLKFFIVYLLTYTQRISLLTITCCTFTALSLSRTFVYTQVEYLALTTMDLRFLYQVSNGFFELNLFSFAVEKVKLSTSKATTRPTLFDYMYYVFHVGKFFDGPIYLFPQFYSDSQTSSSPIPRCWRESLFRVARLIFWALFLELQAHFLYLSALGENLDGVKQLSLPALLGMCYIQGQFFMVKYVLLYGMSGEFLRLDGVSPHPWPRCISWVYSYVDMWKHFDVGLYQFMKTYIYTPLGGSTAGPIRRVLASGICFFFIYAWHGATKALFIWCLGNYLTGLLQAAATALEHSHFGLRLKSYLGARNEQRLRAFLITPIYITSCWHIFYFFYGDKIAWNIAERMFFKASWGPVCIQYFIFTSGIHCALQLRQKFARGCQEMKSQSSCDKKKQ
ncbi:protein-cysteine N-palmitoyltransferase HHAT-like isoform X2 [Physella acuta]|nr:protein-cysteine N-palmitoyltransferase HHAT-like isoform X2 [Physella acuta]XP_059148278.1 protein-cysteine N-palmitoyltransferase HHAT-like isoform X2 [Physella acuta]XP_059148279.1 protein-cysteine N-palmitoyltransferase HHAT-like isoform X2 [Physella acuta]XP_059148280.1 protein-cysteine N-palmitoyltransferase HHAT-like isoform X2 [Physella acuta]XP_059148281.1 protein-cysteine N-palmitoyltransferase HHAT-like isoform X2 [Physella acuta]